MENINEVKVLNPLAELISDEVYNLLNSQGLINEKSVRNYQIRRKFRSMRIRKVSATEALDSLQCEYPYLQFDTIRKIVYHAQK